MFIANNIKYHLCIINYITKIKKFITRNLLVIANNVKYHPCFKINIANITKYIANNIKFITGNLIFITSNLLNLFLKLKSVTMITINLSAILNDREIKKHVAYLHQNGFTWHTASRMMSKSTKGITFKNLERLCTILHCTPNDVLMWSAENGAKPDANQPLHQLVPPEHNAFITNSFKNLPIEKLRKIRKIIEQEVTKDL